jgi:integrase
MGYLYRPKLKSGARSGIWWAKYYVNGRAVRESTSVAGDTETPPAEARRFLKEREGRVATGAPILPRADRVRYEEAAADLRRHYEATSSRNLSEYTYRVAHLAAFFASRRIGSIGQADVDAYTVSRQGKGAAGSTIRRELGTLTRMLRLAYETGKLLRLPILHKPKEGAPREGFFEREQYEAVRRRLAPDLQAAVAIAYTFGWRTQSEVLTLERRQLDLEASTLRLEPGSTKNDDGRVVYLTPELKGLLAAQLERVRAVEKATGRIIPYLFPYLSGKRRLGERRRDFRKAWAAACKAAGVPGMHRHDFRRTAVRNMVNAGVPERVAMKVTGHKTRAVFDRYHIVSPADLRDASAKLAAAGEITRERRPRV